MTRYYLLLKDCTLLPIEFTCHNMKFAYQDNGDVPADTITAHREGSSATPIRIGMTMQRANCKSLAVAGRRRHPVCM